MTTNPFPISKKLRRIETSATLAITQKVRTLRAEGRDIIGLSAGEPDFDTPDHIKVAAMKAINDGRTKYTNVDGIPELKSAICEKFKRDNQIEYALDEINVSPGGKAVIYNALVATIDPGDEVIIPTPCWVSYPDMVKLVGGCPVLVQTRQEDRFVLNSEQLNAVITDQTKWLFLNSPSNPTGAGYMAADLQALAEVLRNHPHVMVLCDDIYEHLVYDGFTFSTLAQIAPDLKSRILTMNGVSKAYAMTGWRIGYAGGPKWLIKAMAKVMGQTTSNAASISQYAALAALNGSQDFVTKSKAVYQKRRDIVMARLENVDGLSCQLPDGAFYIFADCQNWLGRRTVKGVDLKSDIDFVNALIDEAGVAVVPGTAFHAPGHFRLSYSIDTNDLQTACSRIADFSYSLG